MSDGDDFFAPALEYFCDFSGSLGLAASGSDGADGDDGLGRGQHCFGGAEEHKVGSAGVGQGGLVHHFVVGDVGVGEDDQVGAVFADELGEFALGMYGDSVGIEGTGQFGGVDSVFDVGYLSCGKGDDSILFVVPEVDVEVVKVSTGGA